jgi:hypothetical protein
MCSKCVVLTKDIKKFGFLGYELSFVTGTGTETGIDYGLPLSEELSLEYILALNSKRHLCSFGRENSFHRLEIGLLKTE